MSEYPTYAANSLNEILMHVPTDKLAICMRDMSAGLLQAAEMRDQYQSLSEAMGLPFDREAFVNSIPWTWVDDGKCVVRTTIKASHEGETVSVTREVDHLAGAQPSSAPEQPERIEVDRALLDEIMTCMGGTGWRCAADLRALLDGAPSHV